MGLVYITDGRVVSSATGNTVIGINGTILAGSTIVTLSHNLGSVPSYYSVTPLNDYAVGVSIIAVTTTTITAAITTAQGGDALIKVGVAI